ncbi:hypothetical protein TSAR_011199 [Trichomalopsis sarcophagae]|uniref:Uncharacterized protein n=1 Tax=Trichomalopsis sarcophagae TaxID=543379 RepID=A0A232FDS6_9HYME|nr:hypothetical protein TSAR_011199 [Trichomalopsis sarcophagae]
MKGHTCSPEATAHRRLNKTIKNPTSNRQPVPAMIGELSSNGESLDDMSESVDELRQKLANMKRLMEERKGTTLGEISARKQRHQTANIIDGTFLSWIFGTALAAIVSVSFYAFFNLFQAVRKKFPSSHTEL